MCFRVKHWGLIACAMALLVTGCVAFESVDSLSPGGDTIEPDPGDPDPDLEDPCLCRDDGCFEDWLRDVGRCDECVVFSCDYGEVHACARCPGDLGIEPLPKGPKDSVTGGMGVDRDRPL